MKLLERAAAVSQSTHAGRALKVAKVLNLVGTVRGAVTTVLVAASAIGGAVTVNNVRQDIVQSNAAAASASARPRTTAPATATPLTAAALRADAERRLRSALDQDAAAVDDLRRVSVLAPEATDALIAQARQRLQARFDLALAQIDQLLAAPAASGGPSNRPTASLSVLTVNSLVQVALGDLNGILVAATRTATTAPTLAPTARPTPSPTVAPTAARTPTPTPVHTASATVRPSATR